MTKESEFDIAWVRRQFPSLEMVHDGNPMVFFDGPGGTQMCSRSIREMIDYMQSRCANSGGAFETSRRTDETVRLARAAMADLLNAPEPETIVFGANMTTLTFHLARSIGETLTPGDEIVVTNLDHDANVTPWVDLERCGAVIRVADIDPSDATLTVAAVESLLTERTRLVAVTHASNAVGTAPDVAAIVRSAHAVGALVFVDAVQYVPHGPVDVQALNCDFLACSAYKFFGPHVGVLYGKREHMERLTPHKVRPAKDVLPYRWETGTPNYEGLAGVLGAVDHISLVGERCGEQFAAEFASKGYSERKLTLKSAMRAIKEYERTLALHLLDGLESLPGISIYGLTDRSRIEERGATVAFNLKGIAPRAVTEYLGSLGVCCWSGNYYALRLMERLGLEPNGAVRIGPVHYNTVAEVDRLIGLLHRLPR